MYENRSIIRYAKNLNRNRSTKMVQNLWMKIHLFKGWKKKQSASIYLLRRCKKFETVEKNRTKYKRKTTSNTIMEKIQKT